MYMYIYLPDDVHRAVENKRGAIPRSRYFRNALLAYMQNNEKVENKASVRGHDWTPEPHTEAQHHQELVPNGRY